MINFANDDERQGGVICIVTLIKTEIVNVWSIVMKVTAKILYFFSENIVNCKFVLMANFPRRCIP